MLADAPCCDPARTGEPARSLSSPRLSLLRRCCRLFCTLITGLYNEQASTTCFQRNMQFFSGVRLLSQHICKVCLGDSGIHQELLTRSQAAQWSNLFPPPYLHVIPLPPPSTSLKADLSIPHAEIPPLGTKQGGSAQQAESHGVG